MTTGSVFPAGDRVAARHGVPTDTLHRRETGDRFGIYRERLAGIQTRLEAIR